MPLPLFCLAIRVFGNEALPTLAITVPGKALHVHAYQLTLRSSRPSRSTTRRARCCCCSPGSSSARSSCSSPSPCSASPLSTSSGRAEGDYAPPPTHPHTHTQHRDRPSTHPRLAALPRPARTLTARPCLRQRGARGRGQGDEATLRWEVRSHREADHVRLPAQLSRGPVNKIVHQLIQWQLTEFSRVEKRQSAANPSPPEDEFASFYVTTALYDLVLLLIEADAQTRRAPRHTDFTTQSQRDMVIGHGQIFCLRPYSVSRLDPRVFQKFLRPWDTGHSGVSTVVCARARCHAAVVWQNTAP